MKTLLATMILLTAVLALLAGGFAMASMGSNNHTNCLEAIPGSPQCLGGMDPFQFAITHINSLLGVSLGITGPLVMLLFSLLAVLAWLVAPGVSDPLLTASDHSRTLAEGKTDSARKQRHWISLLEKRDPSLFCTMNA